MFPRLRIHHVLWRRVRERKTGYCDQERNQCRRHTGPRYIANGKEMARRGGELVGGITAFANGPDETREVIKHHVDLGVDNIKLSMSGEEVGQFRLLVPVG